MNLSLAQVVTNKKVDDAPLCCLEINKHGVKMSDRIKESNAPVFMTSQDIVVCT